MSQSQKKKLQMGEDVIFVLSESSASKIPEKNSFGGCSRREIVENKNVKEIFALNADSLTTVNLMFGSWANSCFTFSASTFHCQDKQNENIEKG